MALSGYWCYYFNSLLDEYAKILILSKSHYAPALLNLKFSQMNFLCVVILN